MRRAFLMVAALLSLTASGRALDFEIKEVIKVGPIYGFALYPPMLWSPDGTMLAYFANNCLMIADTLGHARQAAKVEMVPDRFCWAGNGEVIVKEVVRSSRD